MEEGGYMNSRDTIEIRTTKDGKIFGIRKLTSDVKDNTVTFKAEVAGDIEAGKQYLSVYAKMIMDLLKEWGK